MPHAPRTLKIHHQPRHLPFVPHQTESPDQSVARLA